MYIYVYIYIYLCMCVHIYIYIYIYITCRYECCLYPHASKTSPSIWIILAFGPRFHLDLSLCINLSDIAHLGNSVRILLEGPLRSSEDVPGSFSLKLDKSGVRINRAPGQGRWGAVQQERRGLN